MINNFIKVFSNKNSVELRNLKKFEKALAVMCGLDSVSMATIKLRVWRNTRFIYVEMYHYNEFVSQFRFESKADTDDLGEEMFDMWYTSKLIKWGCDYAELADFTPTVKDLIDFAKVYEKNPDRKAIIDRDQYWADVAVVSDTTNALSNYMRTTK